MQLLGHFAFFPSSLSTLSLLQDENDNPPTFSKASYVITVLEDIMAGMGHSLHLPWAACGLCSQNGVGDPFLGGQSLLRSQSCGVWPPCTRAGEGTL